MKDRSPLYPGRVTLTPVSGQANTYDMTRADQPTEEGTPLNKNTLLKDATAALYGLGSDAVPDEVLEMLKGSLKVEPGQVQTDKAFVNFNVGSGYQNVSEARALGYGDGTYVSFGNGVCGYSNDNGRTWTPVEKSYSYSVPNQIGYFNGVFFFVFGSGSYNSHGRSTDKGLTWYTARTSSSQSHYATRWAVSPTKVIAVGTSGSDYRCDRYYDITNWVRTGEGTPDTRYSDGVSFGIPSISDACYPRDIATDGKGTWVVVFGDMSREDGSQYVLVSKDDCATWQLVSLPEDMALMRIAYGNGKFIAIGNEVAVYSTDAMTWTKFTIPDVNSSGEMYYTFTFTCGKFVAAPYAANKLLVSGDDSDISGWKLIENFNLGSNKAIFSIAPYAPNSLVFSGHTAIIYSMDEYATAYTLQTPTGENVTEEVTQALGSVKVETGSYTGTGTYGSSNPNSLTFNGAPVLLIVCAGGSGVSSVQNFSNCMMLLFISDGTYDVSIAQYTASVSRNGTVVSWYTKQFLESDGPSDQLNSSGSNYNYLALTTPVGGDT